MGQAVGVERVHHRGLFEAVLQALLRGQCGDPRVHLPDLLECAADLLRQHLRHRLADPCGERRVELEAPPDDLHLIGVLELRQARSRRRLPM